MFILPTALIEDLRRAHHLVVLTGAGISAESGLPTFREAQTGLWSKFKPEDLATPEAFRRDPKLVWEWYAWRRELVQKAQPNPGHLALAEMQRRTPQFRLITQNVDGLHQRAGSTEVIELHGNIHRTKCFEDDEIVENWATTGDVPPRCARCGGLLRPDVVWFGESLPMAAYYTAVEASQSCDVFLSIGTSGVVEPAASLPCLAARAGATVALINLDVRDEASSHLYTINGRAGEVLPALVRAVWPDENW